MTDERINDVHGFLRLARWVKVRGSGFKTSYLSNATLTRDLTFAGSTFSEGESVDTTMDLEYFEGGVQIDILLLREGNLAVIADYAQIKVAPVISSQDTVADPGVLEVKLPTVGLLGRLYLTPAMSISFEAEGMKRNGNVMTDFEASASYSVGGSFILSFGYRNLYTKWVNGTDRATFRLEGWYFGAGFGI
jgi:hypothetical protein